jgi:hypothetical protein
MNIVDIIPDWNDPNSAGQRRKEMRDYAMSQGFSSAEIAKFGRDGRIVTAMAKARLYDDIVSRIPGQQPMEKKRGGPVSGPGTATSDSIPARLSDGEYIIPTHVVTALGQDFFDQILAAFEGKK